MSKLYRVVVAVQGTYRETVEAENEDEAVDMVYPSLCYSCSRGLEINVEDVVEVTLEDEEVGESDVQP